MSLLRALLRCVLVGFDGVVDLRYQKPMLRCSDSLSRRRPHDSTNWGSQHCALLSVAWRDQTCKDVKTREAPSISSSSITGRDRRMRRRGSACARRVPGRRASGARGVIPHVLALS